MARLEHYSHADGRQKIRELIAAALPICAVVFSHVDVDGGRVHFPIVQVATRRAPRHS